MLKSPLCDLLGIKYPIIQGGMAWVSEAELAAAVSNGGGLGIIAAMDADVDYVRGEIQKAKTLTDKPFGVNVMLMSPHAEAIAQLVIDEKLAVITTGAGNPARFMPGWLAAGIKVLPLVASVTHAKKLEVLGATAVIAEGGEAGGHIGEMSTMPLVPQVADSVSIPVIAAGGIGDGRGLAAALMLGAQGVQMGTRFILAEECTVNANYKQLVLDAADTDTIVTGRRLRNAVRSLKNKFSLEFFEKEMDLSVSNEALSQFGTGALYRGTKEADNVTGNIQAGQISGLFTKIQPAAEILAEVSDQAEALLKNANQWIR